MASNGEAVRLPCLELSGRLFINPELNEIMKDWMVIVSILMAAAILIVLLALVIQGAANLPGG